MSTKSMILNYYILQISIIWITITFGAKFPNDLPQCHNSDSKCLATVITKIINDHPNGHSGLSIPPLEPLHINSIDIVQETNSPISIDLKFKDIDLYGISAATINRVIGFDKMPDNTVFEIYATLPKLLLKGNYKINGQVLVLPIRGDGKSTLTFENMNLIIKYKPKVITKNGKKFIQTEKFTLDFTTTKLSMQFSNLFNGDKNLSDNMNKFLNENWTDILVELKPAISYAIEKILESVINRIFGKVPYESLFLQ